MQENETEQNTKVQEYFTDLEEKVSSRIQKMMFLVTKIRGDSIIRNEYNDRELKEMRKASLQTKDHLGTIWKIIPALGECANLILSLIYDAEYQHSKLIQDNLPLLTKDIEKFNTCIEGMLYEFK